MLVFAFDRDWTVDVNPHPSREAVPLEWVHHLAHETDHAVYAIGNQDLAHEAAVPGVVDIVGMHPADWDDWLGGKRPNGRYETFPTRRERLALIEDLHPDADRYIVVDDLDLSDVAGWEHYHAWDFVPAVERGDIDPTLPWVRDPVADGGYPSRAGIMPADAVDLSSFLDEYSDAPAYELTYTDSDDEATQLLCRVSQNAVRLEQPSAAPGILCTPLDPSADRFIVELDAIRMLAVVDPPPEAFLRGASTPTEEAVALRRLADVEPSTVRVLSVLALLNAKSAGRARRDALQALLSVAAVRPDECTPAIPVLRSLLDDADVVWPQRVLACLRLIGEHSPGEIAPVAADIIPHLEATQSATRREANRCIAAIAEEYPGDTVDAVSELTTVVEAGDNGQKHAVCALVRIAREYPEAVTPAAGPLRDVILDESVSDDVRMKATAALGRVVGESPSVGLDVIDDVAQLLESDNYKLRNNAIALTFEIAALHTDVVEPYVEDIAALLTDEDTWTRVNASGTLARVAEDFPESVAHLTPTFIELLSDDDHRVRENACRTLGRLQASEAQSALEARLHDESNETVRNSITWALLEIDPL